MIFEGFSPFFNRNNATRLEKVEPTYSVSFCSMNCGNPIILDIEAIYQENKKNRKFKNWLNHGGRLSLDDFGCRTIKDRKEIWDIVEKYRMQCYEKVKDRYTNFDIADTIQRNHKEIRKKVQVKTSKGIIKRDPITVFTRPFYDFATWYTYSWADELIAKIKEKSIIIDLGLDFANRENFEIIFSEFSPEMYIHYGHGSKNSIIGQNGKEIINEQNCDVLQNCQVYTTACYTAAHLGHLAVGKGCIVWWGYDKDFRFVTRFNVLDAQMRKLYELLRNKGRVTLKDITQIDYEIKMLIVRCLEHDRDSLKLLGDEKTRTVDLIP